MNPSRPLAILTGIALIVVPLLAWALKVVSFGWLMFIVMLGPIVVLILGYVLQIVIATQGFLSRRRLFGAAAQRRAALAAWTSLLGILLLGVSLPDGGDTGYGSTLQVWLGAYGPDGDAVHAATDGITDLLALCAVVAWVGGFVWLAVEWIAALARRSRERAVGAPAAGEAPA